LGSSNGDLSRHGARDWRPPRDEIDPGDPSHLFAAFEDLSSRLSTLAPPALLLWGDSDPISPVGAGQWLAQTLPRASLRIVHGGTHTFAQTRADEVADLIGRHLSTSG
jgi:poly(3-hydroxyoctanoate) depolymerase